MTKKTRIIVDVPPDLLREVDGLCRAEGISRNEGVRRGLLQLLEQHAASNNTAFGLWAAPSAPKAGGRT